MASLSLMAVTLVGMILIFRVTSGLGQTYEEIVDINGKKVSFGLNNTLVMWNQDGGVSYTSIFLGLGWEGSVAVTDAVLTLNFISSEGLVRTFICSDGILSNVDFSEDLLSQASLVRVRSNASDGTYRLQITQQTDPPVFVQLTPHPIRCEAGVEGTRIKFELTSSSRLTGADSSHGPAAPDVAAATVGSEHKRAANHMQQQPQSQQAHHNSFIELR
ncbi:hypothetical protein GOP47_0021178 [Adiantum capillus-veneris]|uniref:Uncharacterized protein n=1 Tax=Adiantum capillus-veneris TaxID=13818 RepID=A0A9D4Z6V1_ADICA|nr:hypothetical protein GOP47_0021178 [Adiantum capillus-veneris]